MKYFQSILNILILAVCLQLFSGCAGSDLYSEFMTVEGQISVRGNEPFTAVILYTAARNYYVLKLKEEDRRELLTPATYRVTGELYLGQWNGRNFAHLAVSDLVSLDL